MTNAISRFFKRSSPWRYSIFSPGGVWGKSAATDKSWLFLCGPAGTFEARERCLALQDFPLLRIYPSGGLGEGRLVGSRSGVARCGGPWSGPSSPDRGFICCVRPALPAALYPLLWSICIYAPILCNPMEPSVGIICLGGRANIPPRSILRRRAYAPPFSS